MSYISCCRLSVYNTSVGFNHAYGVYKLISCYFKKADVKIKFKKKEKEITKASKRRKGALQLEKLVKEKESLLRKEVYIKGKKTNYLKVIMSLMPQKKLCL